MKFLRKHYAVAILLAAWMIPVSLTIIRSSTTEEQASLGTWTLIAICLAAQVLGLVTGRRNIEPPPPIPTWIPIMLAVAGGIGAMALWGIRGDAGTSLEEARSLHLQQSSTGGSRGEGWLHQSAGILALLGILLASQAKRPVLAVILCLSAACIGWTGIVRQTAGRVDLMLFAAAGICGLISRFPTKVISFFGVFRIGVVCIVLFIFNLVFGAARIESKLANPEVNERMTYLASSLLTSGEAGFKSDMTMFAAYCLIQYGCSPIWYLDYWLQLPNPPTQWGRRQMSWLASRVIGSDWYEERQEVDRLYEPLGIYWNCWATSIRDAVIDFTRPGAVIMFFVLGYICSRLAAGRSRAAVALHVLLLVWVLYGPFFSPIQLRLYQLTAIGLSIAWLVGAVMPRRVLAPRRVTVAPRRPWIPGPRHNDLPAPEL